jgi:hypothetical protein
MPGVEPKSMACEISQEFCVPYKLIFAPLFVPVPLPKLVEANQFPELGVRVTVAPSGPLAFSQQLGSGVPVQLAKV